MSDYIPQELLIEILVRLPVRSLLRFRCVSKLWYSLISSSIFISAHTNFINNHHHHHHHHHHHNHPDLLLVHHFHDIRGQGYFSLRFDNKSFHEFQEFDVPYNPDFRIVGFCNGLLCSTKETIYNLSSGSSGITVLHNPIIKDTLMLPPPTISPHCHSPPAFGFGFDSKRNDYKVVRILEDCHNFSPVEVEVFELKTGSWRILADVIVPTVSILFLVGTFFNGGLHWIGENPTRREGNLHQKSILLFDLCREAFQEMKLPNCLASKSTTNLFTGVCQEKLCLVQYNRFMDDQGYQDLWLAKTCSIWVMKEYGVENSWTKLFNIELREWGIPTAKVLGFRRHGDVVIEADGEVLVYDPKKERPNYLGIVARRGTFYVGDYEESLVFLGADRGGVQS